MQTYSIFLNGFSLQKYCLVWVGYFMTPEAPANMAVLPCPSDLTQVAGAAKAFQEEEYSFDEGGELSACGFQGHMFG